MNGESKRLLIVEDDPGLQSQLRWCFEACDVQVAATREDALACLRLHEPQVVTLDLGLPPDPGGASEGFATLTELLALAPRTKVIVITGREERENAVRAVGLGAYDFYQKPVDAEILQIVVERAFRLFALEEENRRLSRAGLDSPLAGVIAVSDPMVEVCRMIEKVAPTDVTTLLAGESGTGKELLAHALHSLSPRQSAKFVAINCAAIPESLLESELFGYEKGAFTGAAKQTRGKFEYADKGTLFLDEIGDLPMSLQAKLLRFLQERVIERVGGRQEIPVDVRVVCATHRDLEELMGEGGFREDLFYRISEITVRIPPLRERPGDAVILAKAFLDKYAKQYARGLRGFSDAAMNAIEAHPWPGNARELENKVKRAVIMASGNTITEADLELAPSDQPSVPLNLREARERAERLAVVRAVSSADGNLTQAARMLGVTRPTLYTLVSKYGLDG